MPPKPKRPRIRKLPNFVRRNSRKFSLPKPVNGKKMPVWISIRHLLPSGKSERTSARPDFRKRKPFLTKRKIIPRRRRILSMSLCGRLTLSLLPMT